MLRKLLDWLTAVDEHGDSPISFVVFAVTFVGMILAIGSLPGY